MESKVIRLAILQRVIPDYRVSLFTEISRTIGIEAMLFYGSDMPTGKVRSTQELSGINCKRLTTRFIRLGSRIFPYHIELVKELRSFKPDVILCEGESHFIGYLQAMYYRALYNRKAALMHWCFISLPGKPNRVMSMPFFVKNYFRRHFDAFVLYSSFSRQRLLELGQEREAAFVATNVGNVSHFLSLSASLPESRCEARTKIGLPEKFTVLYLGTLDAVKRPGLILDLAGECDRSRFNFVLLGAGSLLDELRERASREKLPNVFLPGRIEEQLPLYYRAADVLLIPGRGGIVISEALAFGLPVIVHQADGTEYDLIQNGVSGIHLTSGHLTDFRNAIEYLANNQEVCADMGARSRQMIEDRFTTTNMVTQIGLAAQYAMKARKKRLSH